MLLELKERIPLDTPKGPSYAHFLIDPGQEHSLLFVTFVNATGECWTWPASDVRLQKNVTYGIRIR